MVARFTASRAFTMKAGTFAVVNTKDNLLAELSAGIGTEVNGSDATKIDVDASSKVLTDASFDHTNGATENVTVTPNSKGADINQIIPLSLAVDNTVSTAYSLRREEAVVSPAKPAVYSAFTWDITFNLSFSSSASLPVGLFLNLAEGSGTWAHEVVEFAEGDTIPASTYKSYADLSGDYLAAGTATSSTVSGNPYYKAAPDNTGKGFRVAFVPKTIPTGSLGLTKVWAPHRAETGDDTQPNFIDVDKTAAIPAFDAETTYSVGNKVVYQDKVYTCKTAGKNAWNAANWTLGGVTLASKTATYETGTTTTKLVNGSRVAQTIGAGKAVMMNGDETGVPESSTVSANTCLSEKTNFLGYFGADAGNTVALTFTCVAYYEGTDPMIVNTKDTIYETMTTSLEFGVSTLTALPS